MSNRFFFRIDLKNFFYSISRNRVSRLLRQTGIPVQAREYAEWSTVRNPYPDGPSHVLPIGFKQSPILASLALWRSAVASAIEQARFHDVFISVYFDDLIGSSEDRRELKIAYQGLLDSCVQANLVANREKLIAPSDDIVAFNCELAHGRTAVTSDRFEQFALQRRGEVAETAFLEYCLRVEKCNYR